MEHVDIVFHLAALKHVVSCEYNPLETIKTNIMGMQNLIEICIDNNVEKFWNKEIFEKVNDIWRLKNPIWKLANPDSYLSLPPNVNLKKKE